MRPPAPDESAPEPMDDSASEPTAESGPEPTDESGPEPTDERAPGPTGEPAPGDPVFERRGNLFVPTELARGPWDPSACHGGAPAALLARAVEPLEPRRPEMALARLTYEFVRPVPLAPLSVSARVLRPGRRARWSEASLTAGGVEVSRLTALAVQRP